MPKTKDRRTEPWTGAEDALVQRWMLEGWKAEAIAVQIGPDSERYLYAPKPAPPQGKTTPRPACVKPSQQLNQTTKPPKDVCTSLEGVGRNPKGPRGHAGWNPSAVPEMYDAEAYAARFAREAIIAPDDVGKAAAATTAAVLHHLPPPQMDKALDQLPREIRTLLQAQR